MFFPFIYLEIILLMWNINCYVMTYIGVGVENHVFVENLLVMVSVLYGLVRFQVNCLGLLKV